MSAVKNGSLISTSSSVQPESGTGQRAQPARLEDGVIRGGSVRYASPAMVESGMPALTAKAGGWASAKTVEETYLHLAASDL